MIVHLERFLVGAGVLVGLGLLMWAATWIEDNSYRLNQMAWLMWLTKVFQILVVLAVLGAVAYLLGGLLLE